MEKHFKQIIQELHFSSLSGRELEEKEALMLDYFRQTDEHESLKAIMGALAVSGTILAVPALFAVTRNTGGELVGLAHYAVIQIKERALKRGSILPDEFFTVDAWRPEWKGSKNGFLSYVSALANIHVSDDDQAEVNRIGEILVDEMRIDITPYDTFLQYRICAVDWDFQEDYKIVLDHIEQESVMEAAAEAGIEESWETFFEDNYMDLKYDYLLTRLRMAEKFEYHKFVLKIAECLNRTLD